MRTCLSVLALSATLLLVGCGTPDDEPAAVSPATEPSPEPSPEPSSEAAVTGTLTGIGATRADWNANHTRARGYDEGSAYGPLLDGDQPAFASVVGDERIILYVRYFPNGTGFQASMAVITHEDLPADAAPNGPPDERDVCTIQTFASDTLLDETGQGHVLLAWSSNADLGPDQYTSVTVFLTDDPDTSGMEC